MKLIALLASAALVLAPLAQADDSSYLAALAGVPGIAPNPQMLLGMGNQICQALHDGATTASVVPQLFGPFAGFSPNPSKIVDAAQRNLCSDTLVN